MSLLKNGLPDKILKLLKSLHLWKLNGRIELFFLILPTILLLIFKILAFVCLPSKHYIDKIYCFMSGYLTDDRISNLVNYFAISIGVYIAVITLLATSIIGLSEDILRKGVDVQLLFVTKVGIGENIAAVIMGVMLPVNLWPWHMQYFGLIIAAIISFVKFVRLMFYLFQGNMNSMADTIDKDKKEKYEILLRLENIEQDTNYISKHLFNLKGGKR